MTDFHPLFICGHRKCGTTLTLNLFDSHPDLFVFPTDIVLLYAYYPEFTESSHTKQERLDRLKTIIFEDWVKRNEEGSWVHELPLQKFESRFFNRLKTQDTPLNDVFSIIPVLVTSLQEVLGINNAKYHVVKETSIEIYADSIFDAYPDAQMVQVIRDPRDNFAALKSGLERYAGFGHNAKSLMASFLNRYILGWKRAEINKQLAGNDQYHIVKFEDITRHSKETMESLASDLGIEYRDTFLQPTQFGISTTGNSYDDVEFSGISDRNVGRWPERISEKEAKIIEFYFQNLMQEYDYELAFSREEQAHAASDFYRWSNYEYFFHDRFSD